MNETLLVFITSVRRGDVPEYVGGGVPITPLVPSTVLNPLTKKPTAVLVALDTVRVKDTAVIPFEM